MIAQGQAGNDDLRCEQIDQRQKRDHRNQQKPKRAAGYVLGNPPFIGAKFQSVQQREQVRRIAALGKSGGTLDFVCAWFLNAGAYAKGGVDDATLLKVGFQPTMPLAVPPYAARL
jgi:hypothetical protein